MHFCVVNETNDSYTIFIFNRSTRKRMGTNFTAMYALKNKVQLIGNLGNAPEVKSTESGKKLVRFSVATDESYRNANGERVKQTQWHNVIAWGTVADVVEKYLVKGSEIALEGKLIYRNYTDKDGQKKYVTEIQMNEMLMLGSKPSV